MQQYLPIVAALTFSFARRVYSAVYRQLCSALGVEKSLIDANPDAFEMLGHWRGRFYYNLRNWYRLLMMLPGYRINAPFMETVVRSAGGRAVLVLESADPRAAENEAARLDSARVPHDVVRVVPRIPRDPRHASKIDYGALTAEL